MPPTTYEGIVFNESLHRPEPFATVGASRDGIPFGPFLVPSESLRTTKSDAQGRFSLTTTTGYAQHLGAASADLRLAGGISKNLRRNNPLIVIPLHPNLGPVSYRSPIDPESPASKQLRAAVEKILFHYASTGYRTRHSLREYRRLGILTESDYQTFAAQAPALFADPPLIRYYWAREEIRFPSLDQKFTLKKSSEPFP